MPQTLDDCKDVAWPGSSHAGRARHFLEVKPVAGDCEPPLAHDFAEQIEARSASAEAYARTTFGMTDYPRTVYVRTWQARAAYDRRCYLVGLAAIVLGMAVMLGALALLGPSWLRSAASHIAVNDANDSWCLGFDGLSCKQQDAARE